MAALATTSCGDSGPAGPVDPGPLDPGSYFLFTKTVAVPDSYGVRHHKLFIMRGDLSGISELPAGSATDPSFAALAPDHSRIALADFHRVYLLDIANQQVDTVLDSAPPGLIFDVRGMAWSPDSRRLAVSAGRRASYHTLILSAEGEILDSTPFVIPADIFISPFGAWSPDGERVAYTASGLWTSRLDGSDKRQLTQDGEDEWARYSPDGTEIAFTRVHCFPCSKALMVISANGDNLRKVVEVSEEWGVNMPTWSPDGSMIAYYHNILLNFEGVRVVRLNGSGVRSISMRDWPGFLDWR